MSMIKMMRVSATMIRKIKIDTDRFNRNPNPPAVQKVNEIQRVGEFYKIISKMFNSPVSRFREMAERYGHGKTLNGHVKTLKKAICMMGPEKAVRISIKAMGKNKTFEALSKIISSDPNKKNIWLDMGEKNQQKMREVVLTNIKKQ